MSPFEYLDHTADACLRGIGKTVETAFCEAARALFQLMVDLDRVEPRQRVQVSKDAERLDLLLVEWLAALLVHRDISGLLLSRFRTDIAKGPAGYRLSGEAWGEPIDEAKHAAKAEVKGVTYAGLRVEQRGDEWIAQCVVDV